MQERLLRGAADFLGKSKKRSNASAIFANLDGAVGGELLQTSFQFGGEVHPGIINETIGYGTILSWR